MNRILVTGMLTIAASSLVFGKATTKKDNQDRKQSSTIEQELIKLDNEWNDAEVSADIPKLDRILADPFISTSVSGAVETKAAVLEEFKSGDTKLESIAADDYRVRVYGNTAVMNHRATMKGQYKGQDISSAYRTTHVWVKQHGRWHVVATQQTRIAQQ